MSEQATNTAVRSMALELAKVFPNIKTEWPIIAARLIERVQIDALAQIDQREEALQSTRVSLMEYQASVTAALRSRIERLEAERDALVLKAAASATGSPAGDNPGADQ